MLAKTRLNVMPLVDIEIKSVADLCVEDGPQPLDGDIKVRRYKQVGDLTSLLDIHQFYFRFNWKSTMLPREMYQNKVLADIVRNALVAWLGERYDGAPCSYEVVVYDPRTVRIGVLSEGAAPNICHAGKLELQPTGTIVQVLDSKSQTWQEVADTRPKFEFSKNADSSIRRFMASWGDGMEEAILDHELANTTSPALIAALTLKKAQIQLRRSRPFQPYRWANLGHSEYGFFAQTTDTFQLITAPAPSFHAQTGKIKIHRNGEQLEVPLTEITHGDTVEDLFGQLGAYPIDFHPGMDKDTTLAVEFRFCLTEEAGKRIMAESGLSNPSQPNCS